MFNKTILITFVSLFISLVTVNSQAEGSLSVTKQATLEVPPSTAWALLGDFNGLNRWHPAIANSELTSGNGQNKNSKRILTLGDGALIKETLLDYNNSYMSYTYKITESPLPISDYRASIKVAKNAKGTSTITWKSTFNAAGVEDAKALEIITGAYEAGLNSLETLY